MNPAFIPLTVAAAPQTEARAPFTPTAGPVDTGLAAGAAARPSVALHSPDPELEVIREGDRIVGLKLRCGCGAVHELQCLY